MNRFDVDGSLYADVVWETLMRTRTRVMARSRLGRRIKKIS